MPYDRVDFMEGWQISLQRRSHVIAATAFIVPLGFFFPLQSTADFFGQWNNIFMWSALALALAAGNIVSAGEKLSMQAKSPK